MKLNTYPNTALGQRIGYMFLRKRLMLVLGIFARKVFLFIEGKRFPFFVMFFDCCMCPETESQKVKLNEDIF